MKKIYLEFFRGTASVFIMFWHLVFLCPTGQTAKFTGYWGTDALMIFFMLSGLVINLTETSKPKPAGAFLKNRFLRIYPQFIAGMLLAFLALAITNTVFPSLKDTVLNFLFLSSMKDYMGYIAPSIQSNLAIWTLSFEFAFYAIYAITIGHNQKKIIAVWFGLSLIAIPMYFFKQERDVVSHILAVLAFSSIWLVGYYIYEYRNRFYANKYAALFGLGILPLISRMHFTGNFYDPFKYFILSLFAIPFLRYCLQLPFKGKPIKLVYLVIPHLFFVWAALTFKYLPLKNAIIYSTLPYIYIGLGFLASRARIKQRVINFVTDVGTVTGKYSYPLYISHFPIVFIFSRLTHNVWIYLFFSLQVIVLVTYSIENWLQPAIVNYFKNRKKSKQKAPEQQFIIPALQ